MFRCLLHHLQGDHYVICSKKFLLFAKLFCYISFEHFILGVPIVVNYLSILSIDYFEAFHGSYS